MCFLNNLSQRNTHTRHSTGYTENVTACYSVSTWSDNLWCILITDITYTFVLSLLKLPDTFFREGTNPDLEQTENSSSDYVAMGEAYNTRYYNIQNLPSLYPTQQNKNKK